MPCSNESFGGSDESRGEGARGDGGEGGCFRDDENDDVGEEGASDGGGR